LHAHFLECFHAIEQAVAVQLCLLPDQEREETATASGGQGDLARPGTNAVKRAIIALLLAGFICCEVIREWWQGMMRVPQEEIPECWRMDKERP
jgi:hypothetical protein